MKFGFRKAFSVLVLLTLCIGLIGVGAAFANYKEIKQITGDVLLGGDRNGYTATIAVAAEAKLSLTVTASGVGTGTKIGWSVSRVAGDSTNPAPVIPATTAIDSSGLSQCLVTFPNPTPSDKFEIKAELWDEKNSLVTGAANAVVVVSFMSAIEVSRVTLDYTDITVRIGKPVTLKATVEPSSATNLHFAWSSDDTGKATVSAAPSSQDYGIVNAANYGVETAVRVKVTGYNNSTAEASCIVRVVDKDEVADDMLIPPVNGNEEELYATHLYAVDSDFVSRAYVVTDSNIIDSAGMGSGSTVRYLLTSNGISPTPTINVNRSAIMSALGVTDYATTTAAALRFDLTFPAGWQRHDMVPIVLRYDLNGLRYPDGATLVVKPTSAADFYNQYRLVKYFQKDNTQYNVDLTDILYRKSPGSFVKFVDDKIQVDPLVVLVDGPAPTTSGWCDAYTGPNNEFGVRYDSANRLLFIYDGTSNSAVNDPIVMEKRVSYGGSGGGGCDAGMGIFAFLAAGALFGAARARKAVRR